MRYQVYFVSESVLKKYNKLKNSTTEDKKMFKILTDIFEKLEEHPTSGIAIPKRLIPKSYLKKYKMKNCWKYDLPDGWRLIYYLKSDGKVQLVMIVKWMPHDEYERDFNY
ncbi:type II toxin-antitoxin system RelE family toxin [Methanocella conradii]|uniref:type II toxin-antitoxin system RelE family toxin n=1 Tax=Methanocella conradii TaxID=1175444 RepID=UPI00064FFC03|nr:hypothetical protein [Methanocella conradii]